ncbi:hypothetical protein [Neisseria gonorrhoeae]
MKPLNFSGGSLDCLRQFPENAKQAAGYQLQEKPENRGADSESAEKRYNKLIREKK